MDTCSRINYIISLPAMLFLLSSAVFATDLTVEERLQALEYEQKHHRVSSYHTDLSDEQAINLSGFGSFTATQLTEDGTGVRGESKDLSIHPYSLIGLQLDADLGVSTSAAIQIVAEGYEDFQTEVEWMYIIQDLLPHFSLKLGRFAYAVFAESINEKVGYTYPTVALNREVYTSTLVESIDGVSFDFSQAWQNWHLMANVYVGERQANKERENIHFNIKRVYGAFAIVSHSAWEARLTWHRTDSKLTLFDTLSPAAPPGCTDSTLCPLILDMKNENWGFSSIYRAPHWYAQYEAIFLQSENDYVGDIFGQSVTLAYAYDVYQPYLQWGNYNTRFSGDQINVGTNDRKQQSITFGLRHDFEPYLAVKYQAKYIYGFQETQGLFNYYSDDIIDFDNTWQFDISLQFVFGDLI